GVPGVSAAPQKPLSAAPGVIAPKPASIVSPGIAAVPAAAVAPGAPIVPASAKPAAAVSTEPVALKPETKKETTRVPASASKPMPQATVQLKAAQPPSQSASVSTALKIQPVAPVVTQQGISPVIGGIAAGVALVAVLVQLWMML
ncbi:MAG: hypothetical protein ABIP97_06345, partial [Chthoniobacterales bacterium]